MALTSQTYADLITQALKNAGVLGLGQTAAAEDMNDSCRVMNDMIAQWQQRRYLVYHLVEQSIPCTGAQSYSMGPGGDISIPERPAEINAAFARQVINANPNQIDYPLMILPSRETYSQIAMKSLQSFPQWVWWDAAWPLGYLFVYPVITNQFELHVIYREQLQTAVALTDTINVPSEYREAITYNLGLRLAVNYGLQPTAGLVGLAKSSLETMRAVNAQVPQLSLPPILNGRGPHYNIFSDRAGPTGW